MSKKIIFILVGFVGVISLSFSQTAEQKADQVQLNTITTSLPFMSITPDSRAGGMGDAGTALSANSNSIYWNTSMLNFAEKNSEISLSYTPWLRQLTNDIHLTNLSGFTRMGSRHAIGGNLRYFSLGEITFTDNTGNVLRDDKPNEFEITLGYAFKLSDKLSIGINGKFANSNLTGGLVTPGANTKAARAGAADISFTYYNPEIRFGGYDGRYTFAATINNIGNKVSYSDASNRDFLPTNLKIGNSYMLELDKYNSITLALDVQKLLVPSPPIYNDSDVIIAGKNNDVGVVAGMLQSFYDAPGIIMKDANGEEILTAEGLGEIKKGSVLREELREINLATGLEYWYNNTFAVRTGFFYEHRSKGARQYFNVGLGLKYNMIGIDLSYLLALQRNNPLANTLRFTIRFDIGSNKKVTESKPE
jgi:hypothetical protein